MYEVSDLFQTQVVMSVQTAAVILDSEEGSDIS